MLHDGRASESANHEPQQMQLQVIRGMFLWHPRHAVLCEADDEASHTYLGAHIEKLGQHAFE